MAAQARRRRGAPRGRGGDQGPRPRRDRRPLRGEDPRARPAACPHRPLVRRTDPRAAARPGSRPGGRRHEPRAAQGHPRPALLIAEGRRSCARAPVQAPRHRPPDARGVHLRLREHVHAGSCSRRLRDLCRPGDRPDLLRGGARELPPRPPERGALQERRARTAPHRRGGEGPHGAGIALPQAVREVRALARPDGLHRVRGQAAPAHGGRRLGGGRRGDRRLARRRPRRYRHRVAGVPGVVIGSSRAEGGAGAIALGRLPCPWCGRSHVGREVLPIRLLTGCIHCVDPYFAQPSRWRRRESNPRPKSPARPRKRGTRLMAWLCLGFRG